MKINDEWVAKATELGKREQTQAVAISQLRVLIEDRMAEVMPLISQRLAEAQFRLAGKQPIIKTKPAKPLTPAEAAVEADKRRAIRFANGQIKVCEGAARYFNPKEFATFTERALTITKDFGPNDTLHKHGLGASDLLPQLFYKPEEKGDDAK